ncbi:RDD family protein [Lactobacillus acetotolerans]|uniref:RDD family protein n=1 Tax=Lactobacillus acetotolerans TaxID=1600 RepID=A0A5P5ZGH5_9LACO|nr:RDD family protein [Lactobacillus acetotolerans]KRN39507.1 hypothetical protein FC77_GL001047 [Lactobacillus acetotolerans DSM 20749 = JCM 3825]QFG50757.1 RDD family protein [Lactobacillus acetotolerans]GGV17001.1 hypothetical protein GCM10011628_12980 [Lactobacillus acetotolerans DSM 20749 = JCM 3825]
MSKRKKKTNTEFRKETIPNITNQRIFAAITDWILGGIICSLPAVLFFCMISKSNQYLTSFYNFQAIGVSKLTTVIILIISILLTFGYYVVIPLKIYPGQTLGKHFFHLKIVHLNGTPLTFKDYFLREVIILNLIEGSATYTSNYFRVLITTLSNINVDGYFSIFWNIATLASIFLLFWKPRHLAIHDYLTHSTVVSVGKELQNA